MKVDSAFTFAPGIDQQRSEGVAALMHRQERQKLGIAFL
jgi:hypothetical protein